MPSMYVVKRCLSKALVISLSLTMLQVITGSFSLSLSSAYTQGTATNGTSYGGTGGSPNGANQNCSSGAIVAIGTSKSGNNLNSFMFVCKTVNNDASLSATEATTPVFNYPLESDRCSAGQIGIGVRVIASNGGTLVGGVGLICGNPMSGGSQNTRSIMPDALSAGTVYTYTCGTGQLLAGFYLRTGALVDQLTPKCSTFSGFAYAAVGAPTATVTGNTASVSFTPVTGSTADTSLTYTVSAVPNSGSTITVTGNASPISVPNLVLRANYTVTVTASNAYGSSPSTSSVPATVAAQSAECIIGATVVCPATSAQEIYNLYGTTTDGTYWIFVNGIPTQVFLKMNRTGSDNGAWILLMKGAKGTTNFNYESNNFTSDATTLNTNSLLDDVTTDAKFSVYNSLTLTKMLAVLKDPTTGTVGSFGDIQSNSFGGHVWLETLSSASTAYTRLTTTLSLNSPANFTYTSVPKSKYFTSSSGTQVFSYQAGYGRYGFNGDVCTNVPSFRYRWGIAWNQESDWASCDVVVGIGLGGAGASPPVVASPGDQVRWSGVVNGSVTTNTGHGNMGFQIWGKVAEPSLNAVQSLAATISSTTASVSWSAPSGVTPTDYVVEYKPSASGSFSNSFIVTGQTTASIAGLTAGTAYDFRVIARTASDSTALANIASVTVRPLTIKAADKSSTYTGSSASISNSYSITSGALAGSDTFTALTYTYSSAGYSASQTAPTNAGTYTITPSAASFSVGSASNYSINYETATLTINKANQSSLTITSITSKYGTPLRLVTSGGSGTGAISFAIASAGTASGCAITSETLTVTSFGTCNVTATKALDTNYFVKYSETTTITFAKADTITVTTTLSSNTVTYTQSPAAITTTQTVTGLVNSETATVTSTYTANSCEYGGTCVIGNVAPGGGYVFYVSATTINVATGISSGGIYLATAPQTWSGGSIDPNASFGCGSTNIASTSDSVGSGAENTRLINAGCATAGIASRLAADSSAEGFTDWFIPSIDELTLIYNNLKLNSLSNLQSWNYWSSTQGTTLSYGKYWWFGSGAVSGQTDKNNSAASNMYVRPIRAFSPTALASATVPTDAGVYKVGSTFAISSPASLSNYQGVESVTATLTINKANQRAITIGQYLAYPNISSYPLNVYGGSGPGVLTRTLVSAGTAGCSLASSFILTATSVGSCTVKAEKAGTRNYIVESTTATIYWIAWLDNYAAQTLGGNNVIPLAGGNQIIVRTETLTASAFSNTSGGAITSAAVGATIRINSTGFSGLSPSDLSVTFRPYEDAVVSAVTSTYVEVVIPAGATTGVIAIDSPRGVAYTQSFTISP